MINPFFINKGPFSIKDIFTILNISKKNLSNKKNIKDVRDLFSAEKDTITFFHSSKYKSLARLTKASYCLTSKNLINELPKNCFPIIVENVLISVAKITKKFYPNSINDEFDITCKNISETILCKKVKFGYNVLIGENVKINSGCSIGHNSIIEKNVRIGKNCKIGSSTIIRNSIIKDNVTILDHCVIGKKGFGFFPNKNKNHRYPHIGAVIIHENCEIGSGSTIDRGSLSNTEIGKNTFIDNQVHIAHNVKIGANCSIAGQVGIAGSSILGKNIKIGGQAGISGHLIIGNNVQIAGGSGVIRDISDNQKVMGYPAKDVREFLKDNK
ncbi:MAG: UDP-3-O-(3-hydroxymyristoyl)glucosamine N-acyltransferase [Pelagibacteraceae bacterium]|nr:MAG: UDP-3-O-(3-hydroxymyristoyl)glucosamine N-acyltransferase [Pelagibacteraceae bacterium]